MFFCNVPTSHRLKIPTFHIFFLNLSNSITIIFSVNFISLSSSVIMVQCQVYHSHGNILIGFIFTKLFNLFFILFYSVLFYFYCFMHLFICCLKTVQFNLNKTSLKPWALQEFTQTRLPGTPLSLASNFPSGYLHYCSKKIPCCPKNFTQGVFEKETTAKPLTRHFELQATPITTLSIKIF